MKTDQRYDDLYGDTRQLVGAMRRFIDRLEILEKEGVPSRPALLAMVRGVILAECHEEEDLGLKNGHAVEEVGDILAGM
jgi:hypothetical protein